MLILVRHGQAVPKSKWNGENYNRPLTDQGRSEFQRVAAKVAEVASVDLILTSPKTRTAQTAAILAEATGAPLQVRQELSDLQKHDPAGIAAWLSAMPEQTIAVVSHAPILDDLFEELVEEEIPGGIVKGAAIAIEPEAPGAQDHFAWAVYPPSAALLDDFDELPEGDADK